MRNCIVKFFFSLELYIKLKTWSFRGAGLGMMKASTKNISRDTSFKEEYSKNKISRDKLVILQQFLQRRPTENLKQTECECIRAAKLVSLVTCDILTRYQQVLLNQFSAIYFVHPLLFEINSQNGLEAVPNDLLPTNLNLDRFRFLFNQDKGK